MTDDAKQASVQRFLDLIEAEKQKPRSQRDRGQMRRWLLAIQRLKFEDDYRETYTGQDAKYQIPVSVRDWDEHLNRFEE